jgi:hypothetical protein
MAAATRTGRCWIYDSVRRLGVVERARVAEGGGAGFGREETDDRPAVEGPIAMEEADDPEECGAGVT